MEMIKTEDNGLMTNDLLFAKVKPTAIIPTKEDENAGYDIYACFDDDFKIIPAHSTMMIPTGIACAVCDKYYLNVAERSSTGKIGMKYSAGIIDSGYRGEINILLTNANSVDIIISKLSLDELVDKYGEIKGTEKTRYAIMRDKYYNTTYLIDSSSTFNQQAIIYPYTKAIAQLIVHEVPRMNVKEVTYEELLKIPSKRGVGAFGSSGK